MAKYTIRDAHQDDLPGIVSLRTSIKEFRNIDTEEYIAFWNSLIKTNPGLNPQILVAENNEHEIVAHYAMVPFSYLKDGEPLVGGFLCQLMVHEQYRQELIFPKMELKFLKDYPSLGFHFAFSLGNREKVVKAHLSFGFSKIGEIPVYGRPYKITSIARRYVKNGLLQTLMMPGLYLAEKFFQLKKSGGNTGVSVTEEAAFDSGIDRFCTSMQKHFPCSALRNADILNWRFSSSAFITYKILVAREAGNIVGYAVLRRMDMNWFDVLAIVDILFPPDRRDVGKTLINAVHNTALQMNVEMSACLLNADDPLCHTLQKCGYFKTPETFSLFVHEPRGRTPHFNEDSINKWHITWFDNDAV